MSDILEAYAKIMAEKGLIKTSEDDKPKKSKELQKYEESDHPRLGSDTLEVIKNLYNVKPDSIYTYKNNIMEVAHPDKVLISPTYDRLNALVENNNEQNKILLNIVHKQPNGHLTNHRYATQNLMMTLTKVANDLDNRNQEKLRILADNCISQLHAEALSWSDVEDFFKEKGTDALDVGEGAITGALSGAVVGGLVGAFGGPFGVAAGAIGGAALGGTLAALFKTGPQAKNVAINASIAQQRLVKVSISDPVVQRLNASLMHIVETANQYADAVARANVEMNEGGTGEAATTSQSANNEAKDLGVRYQDEIAKLDGLIQVFLSHVEQGHYAPKDDSIWDKIKVPYESMVGAPLQDAVKALKVLQVVAKKAIAGIIEFRTHAQQIPQVAQNFSPVKPPPQLKSNMPTQEEVQQYLQALQGH